MTETKKWFQAYIEFPRQSAFGFDFETAAVGPPRKSLDVAANDEKLAKKMHDAQSDWKKVRRRYFSKQIWPVSID